MKNKTSVNLIAFAVTLLFSTAIVTNIFNNTTFSFFSKENSFKTRVKIYNFLIADKVRYKRYAERNAQHISKLKALTVGYTLHLSPDAKIRYVREFDLMLKTLNDERLNADTSGLPEDFRKPWSRFTIAAINLSNSKLSETDSKITVGSREPLIEDLTTSAEEYRRVAKNYGFELGPDLVLIDEER